MHRLILALPLLALVAACNDSTGVCTLEARSSFAITVVDSVTGTNLAPAATVRVTEGAFSDTLFVFPGSTPPVYSGVFERPGVYTVTVTHPLYRTWTQNDVRVQDGGCHVVTQVFTARLLKQ